MANFDVFVSCSFSSKVDYDSGEVDPEYRRYIESVLTKIRKNLGMTAFCAIEHEGWRISDSPPEEGVKADLDAIDAARIMLVLLNSEKSDGRSYECGYASAKGKRVYALLEPGVEKKFSYWNQGLVNAGLIRVIDTLEEIRSAQ